MTRLECEQHKFRGDGDATLDRDIRSWRRKPLKVRDSAEEFRKFNHKFLQSKAEKFSEKNAKVRGTGGH